MEAFESLCVRFRRLRNQNGDPQFGAAKNRLAKGIREGNGTEEDRETAMAWLAQLGSWHRHLEREWVGGVSIKGGEITPEDAVGLVFNGEIFHRNAESVSALAEHSGWQWTLVGFLYHQIEAFSRLYWDLALGIDAAVSAVRNARAA